MTPPSLAALLLSALLPEEERECLLGDLVEEYERFVLPDRGPLRARLWFWQQAIRSLPAIVRLRHRSRRRASHRSHPMRGVGPMFDLWHDVRYGARVLWKTPLFTLVALATLALGIGANVTIFAAIQAVLLRPLPFSEPERLVAIWEKNPERNWMFNVAAPANMLDWRERNRSFVDVGAYGGVEGFALSGEGDPEMVPGYQVTGNFFDVLGVPPLLGRGFRVEETWAGQSDVVVLSEKLWRRRFGAEPGVVGRRITVDGKPLSVVGVMPSGFDFPSRQAELWTSVAFEPPWRAEVWFRRAHFLSTLARLKPGVSLDEARTDLESIASDLEREYPETNRSMGAGLTPLREWIVGDSRPALLVLFASVALVLLVACANVANLLLAKASTRAQEVAVRSALGAGRARIARQLLIESLILSGVGGAAGVVLANLSLPALIRFVPEQIPRLSEARIDGVVLGFTVLACVATALLFGLAPALQASRGQGTKLRLRGRSRPRASTRQLLVVSEVALAVVLAAGAGLFIRSFLRLTQVSPGFEPGNLWTADLSVPETRYPEDKDRARFHRELLDRVRALPGIVAAASVDSLPLTGTHWTSDFLVEGHEGEVGLEFNRRRLSPGYFRTMGVPLRSGREFTDSDDAQAPPVVVINRALAERYFPNEDPIGRHIAFENEEPRRWLTVVGVAGNEKTEGLAASAWPEIFVPWSQVPAGTLRYVWKPKGDPEAALRAFRSEVAALDPDLPLSHVGPLEDVVTSSVSRQRFLTTLVGAFAALALALAAIGIYGVVSFGVSQRTYEISVRMALGARASDVVRMMTRESFVFGALGVALGIVAALALGRVLGGLLFDVSTSDPGTFSIVAVVTIGVAYLASYLPARRATRVEPASSLRAE
jgi:putative ABC transport system permease protein